MKIIVLNGSPRANGNTAAMVAAFKEGALEKGHEVEVVNVAHKKIGGCMGCDYCRTKGEGKCIQQDDMPAIYEAVKEADMLVLASPVYYWTLSAQLQAAIHRFYPSGAIRTLKKSAMLLSSGSDGVYDACKAQYRDAIVKYMQTEDMGIITAYGAQNKSEETLEACRALGRSL